MCFLVQDYLTSFGYFIIDNKVVNLFEIKALEHEQKETTQDIWKTKFEENKQILA